MESELLSKFQAYKNLTHLMVLNENGKILTSKPEIKDDNKEEKFKIEEAASILYAQYKAIQEINNYADSTKSIFTEALLRFKKNMVTIIPSNNYILVAVQNKE